MLSGKRDEQRALKLGCHHQQRKLIACQRFRYNPVRRNCEPKTLLETFNLERLPQSMSYTSRTFAFANFVFHNLYENAPEPVVYAQIGHTSLVHDLYFRLSKPEALDVWDRAHFYAVAGKAMRHLLIDQRRERRSVKHAEGQIQSTD
jgi:hypothetical protein